MNTKKLFLAALLMLSALSVFAQNNTVVFEGKSLALTYENLSALIKAGEKTQAVAVLKAKPELATSLKLEQVEALDWESFVEVGAKTFRRIPLEQIPAGEPWKTMDEENDRWVLTKDKAIIMEYFEEKIETAREKAETAREKAETAREKAETARVEAEAAREKAKTARMEEIESDFQTWQEYKNDLNPEEVEAFKEEIVLKISKLETEERKELVRKMFSVAGLDLSTGEE